MKGFSKFMEALMIATFIMTIGIGALALFLWLMSREGTTIRSATEVLGWITFGSTITFITSLAVYFGVEQFIEVPDAEHLDEENN